MKLCTLCAFAWGSAVQVQHVLSMSLWSLPVILLAAEVCKEQPPWLRTTNRSGYGSYPSSSSSSGFCPTDTSSEMGGQQSLLTMSSLAPPTGNFAPPTSSLTMTTCTSTSSVLSRDNAATSGGSTSTALGQPPQKQPPNSAGNPPGLHQTSCMNPLNQPKLDSAQTSTPRRGENEATPTKAAYNSEKLSKGGAGVNTLASICQPSGKDSIVSYVYASGRVERGSAYCMLCINNINTSFPPKPGGITSTHVLNKQEYTSNGENTII